MFRPAWDHPPADAVDARMPFERAHDRFDPVRRRPAVIVRERQDWRLGLFNAGVSAVGYAGTRLVQISDGNFLAGRPDRIDDGSRIVGGTVIDDQHLVADVPLLVQQRLERL